jgi:hypothetical protein
MTPKLLAQGIYNPVLPPSIGNVARNGGGTVVGTLIGNVMGAILIIGFLLAMLYLLMGGLSWVTSGGDKAQLEMARNKIINAIIGLIILASAWAVMMLLAPFLGLTFPELLFPTIPST